MTNIVEEKANRHHCNQLNSFLNYIAFGKINDYEWCFIHYLLFVIDNKIPSDISSEVKRIFQSRYFTVYDMSVAHKYYMLLQLMKNRKIINVQEFYNTLSEDFKVEVENLYGLNLISFNPEPNISSL